MCIHNNTHRIIPNASRLLAPSPVFSATKESRVIAKMVYSTPLTIFKTPSLNALIKGPELDPCEAAGTIRISW